MSSTIRASAVPAGDRTRKASSPLEARLRDIVANHATTAGLYRRGGALVDLQAVQDCRACSLWQVGGRWAVVAVDIWASQVHVFDDEGPARDKHTRLTATLAAKPLHIVPEGRKKGTPRARS